MLESVHIAANKNTVRGDVFAMVLVASMLLNSWIFLTVIFSPLQGPALTSRGFVKDDYAKVADFFDMAVKLVLKIKAETKGINFHDLMTLFFGVIRLCSCFCISMVGSTHYVMLVFGSRFTCFSS